MRDWSFEPISYQVILMFFWNVTNCLYFTEKVLFLTLTVNLYNETFLESRKIWTLGHQCRLSGSGWGYDVWEGSKFALSAALAQMLIAATFTKIFHKFYFPSNLSY